MVNSRVKGAVGERKFRDFLRQTYGDAEAKRGQQRKGGEDSPDVDSPFLKMLKIHPEVKFMKAMELTHKATLTSWMEQARRDAGDDLKPVVFHRWNRSSWYAIFMTSHGNLCIMDAEEFLDEQWQTYKQSASSAQP